MANTASLQLLSNQSRYGLYFDTTVVIDQSEENNGGTIEKREVVLLLRSVLSLLLKYVYLHYIQGL